MNHLFKTSLKDTKGENNGIVYHEQIANSWDGRYASGGFLRRKQFIENAILPDIKLEGAWLDAGCGSGLFSRILVQKGVSVTGVDGSPAMIKEAAELSNKHMPKEQPTFLSIDTIEKLPFPDGKFNGCICFSVLEYLQNPEKTLQELARVMKAESRLIVSIPYTKSFLRFLLRIITSFKKKKNMDGIAFIKVSNFQTDFRNGEKLFKKFGFELICVKKFDPIIPSYLHFLFAPSLLFFILKKKE